MLGWFVSTPPTKRPGEILSDHQALLCEMKGIVGITPTFSIPAIGQTS
jgi:hypothetical protein